MKRPELLSPAGNFRAMRYAYAFGADAVYAGMPKYSLRARNNEFKNPEILKQGIDEAHAKGKKLYVTANLLPHYQKVNSFINDIEPVVNMKPDALIMADPGLIMMVREKWPDMPIHLSVQMNTLNHMAVKFWQKMGVERIILSRELALDEVEYIRQECPDMELEVFVHGALCMAYSGRCLLSGYFTHRDSNQGVCTNSCRWNYKVHEAQETNEDYELVDYRGAPRHPDAEKVYMLEEEHRKEILNPIYEDEFGTYIMNSKDLRAVEHVKRLVEIGVDCLKIEGRTKSPYYVARTAQVYNQAIEDALAGKEFDKDLLLDLENLSNRGYTGGFYERKGTEEYQNYITGYSRGTRQKFVGELIRFEENGEWMVVNVKNKFHVGDKLEIMVAGGENKIVTLDAMTNEEMQPIEIAPGSEHVVRIPTYGIDPKTETLLLCRFIEE